MPKVSLADTVQDWEGLLAAATEKGAGRPELQGDLAKLRAALDEVRSLEGQRQRLQAERQQATQDLTAARRAGLEVAMGLRGRLVAIFGPRWEGLTQFGVKPIGRPRRKPSRPASAP